MWCRLRDEILLGVVALLWNSCGMALAVPLVPDDEPAAVRDAFARAAQRVAQVSNYMAAFSVQIESLKGSVMLTGTIVQQPPYAFRRQAYVEELNGTTRKLELTVCDGTNGWQIEYAPNGKVLNASRWSRQAMQELFYVFAQHSQLLMLTHDRTNTYVGIRRLVRFEHVQHRATGMELTGRERPETPAYKEVLRVAEAYGAEGISNYVSQVVRLVISAEGIPVIYERLNAYGRALERMALINLRVNTALPADVFHAAVPAGVMVMDLDRALNAQELRLAHPLLGSNAPAINVQYPSGKQATITLGAQPIVLSFFTTISSEGRAFARALEPLYRRYNSKVKFVTVAAGADGKTLQTYARTARLTLPFYCDDKRATARAYRIRIVPCALVIDKQGVIIDAINGSAPDAVATLEQRLRGL